MLSCVSVVGCSLIRNFCHLSCLVHGLWSDISIISLISFRGRNHRFSLIAVFSFLQDCQQWRWTRDCPQMCKSKASCMYFYSRIPHYHEICTEIGEGKLISIQKSWENLKAYHSMILISFASVVCCTVHYLFFQSCKSTHPSHRNVTF